MINVELFRKIYAQITEHPETHDQESWENIDRCGTTRCVAGWALYFHRSDQSIYVTTDEISGGRCDMAARVILGLSIEQAEELFSEGLFSEEAVALVKGYAGL